MGIFQRLIWVFALLCAQAAVAAEPGASALYAARCASCHGATLEGGSGPALTGTAFQGRWSGHAPVELQTVIAQRMPPEAAGSLKPTETQSLAAFILARNTGAAPPAFAVPEHLPAPAKSVARASELGPVTRDLVNPTDTIWPMYNRDYRGQRYSPLAQITPQNVGKLAPRCIFQTGEVGSFQASPLIYGNRLYVTTGHGTYAVDAGTCRKIWQSVYAPPGPEVSNVVNRGAALYEGKVIRGTPDAHLIALDAATGATLWDVWVADASKGYRLSAAPVVFDGKVFIGEGGADYGATGHVYAFAADTGALLWTFNMLPTGDEPGADTWGGGAKYGGGSSWSTISVDPNTRRIFVPIGNPGSAIEGSVRPGTNLYMNSVVVLDADTGKLQWHAQQVAHDVWDWDTAAAPTLYELNGHPYMAVGSKDGWLYVYDQESRKLIARQEIASHLNADKAPTAAGLHVCPGTLGGAEWYGQAFDPNTRALFINSVDWCVTLTVQTNPRTPFGGAIKFDPQDTAKGWLRAFDAASGAPKWVYKSPTPMVAGITTTAGGVVFTGDLNGDFLALDAKSGGVLYRFNTGGAIAGGVSSYAADGKQLVAVASGNASKTIWNTTGAATVIVFGLP